MDVDDLMQRAMESWREMGDEAEEESVTPVDDPEAPPVDQAVSEPAEESDIEPTPNEPEEPLDESDVPSEPPDEPQDDQSAALEEPEEDVPDEPAEPEPEEDEATGDDYPSLPEDPELSDDTQEEMPDEPVDPWERHQTPQEARLSVEDVSVAEETDEPLPLSDGEGDSVRQASSPSWGSEQAAGLDIGAEFIDDLGKMLQPQFSELRHTIAAHLGDAMDREAIIADAMSLEQW